MVDVLDDVLDAPLDADAEPNEAGTKEARHGTPRASYASRRLLDRAFAARLRVLVPLGDSLCAGGATQRLLAGKHATTPGPSPQDVSPSPGPRDSRERGHRTNECVPRRWPSASPALVELTPPPPPPHRPQGSQPQPRASGCARRARTQCAPAPLPCPKLVRARPPFSAVLFTQDRPFARQNLSRGAVSCRTWFRAARHDPRRSGWQHATDSSVARAH